MTLIDLASLDTINVDENIKLKPGQQISEGLIVGRMLSHGVQGQVNFVVDETGKNTDWLLKVTFLRNAFDDLQREWMIGRALNLLQNPTFMFTGPALRTSGEGIFVGMLLKRINGKTVDKIVERSSFHYVQWLQKCLFDVMLAMDQAQKVLGFHHYDLRLGNIMVEGGTEEEMLDAARARFKIIDFGLGSFDEGYALLPSDSEAVKLLLRRLASRQRKKEEASKASTTPLNRLSKGIETLRGGLSTASLLGVVRSNIPNVIMKNMREDSKSSSESFTSAPERESNVQKSFCEPAIDEDEQLETFEDFSEAGPARDDVQDESFDPQLALQDNGNSAKQITKPKKVSRSKSGRFGEITDSEWSVTPFSKGDPIPQFVTSAIFAGYRNFWEHRGDMFYLAFSVLYNLDGRVWPASDERIVRKLFAWVHHVLGVRCKYSLRDTMHGVDGRGNSRRWYRTWRKLRIRMKTFISPYNSGITAAEALCAPLFSIFPTNPYAVQVA